MKNIYLTKSTLNALLDDSTNRDKLATQSEEGPNALNKFALVFDGDEAAWLEATAEQSKQKRIIFSDGLFACPAPTEAEIAFISVLIEHYDVLIWEDNPKALSETGRIKDPFEFFKKRNNIKPASQQRVRSALAKAGVDINEFHILDHLAICQLNEKFGAHIENQKLNSYNCSSWPIFEEKTELDEEATLTTPHHLISRSQPLMCAHEAQEKEEHQEIKAVKKKKPGKRYLNGSMPCSEHHLYFKENVLDLTNLSLTDPNVKESIDLMSVEAVDINAEECRNLNDITSMLPKLRSLRIQFGSAEWIRDNITSIKLHHVNKLIFFSCDLLLLNLNQLKSVTDLDILHNKNRPNINSIPGWIKHLSLGTDVLNKKVTDLSHLTQLENLNVDSNEDPSYLTSDDSDDSDNSDSDASNMAGVIPPNSLKKLSLDHVIVLTELRHLELNNLTELSYYSSHGRLDFSHFKKLKKLNLDTPALEKIKLPSTLDALNILWDRQLISIETGNTIKLTKMTLPDYFKIPIELASRSLKILEFNGSGNDVLLNLDLFPNLEVLILCPGQKINQLPKKLKVLRCFNSNLSNQITLPETIQTIDIRGNTPPNKLNFQNAGKLKSLITNSIPNLLSQIKDKTSNLELLREDYSHQSESKTVFKVNTSLPPLKKLEVMINIRMNDNSWLLRSPDLQNKLRILSSNVANFQSEELDFSDFKKLTLLELTQISRLRQLRLNSSLQSLSLCFRDEYALINDKLIIDFQNASFLLYLNVKFANNDDLAWLNKIPNSIQHLTISPTGTYQARSHSLRLIISNMKSLRVLDVSNIEAIECTETLPYLEELMLVNISDLERLDLTLFPRLRKIKIRGGNNILILFNQSSLLEELLITDIIKLTLESEGQIKCLRRIDVFDIDQIDVTKFQMADAYLFSQLLHANDIPSIVGLATEETTLLSLQKSSSFDGDTGEAASTNSANSQIKARLHGVDRHLIRFEIGSTIEIKKLHHTIQMNHIYAPGILKAITPAFDSDNTIDCLKGDFEIIEGKLGDIIPLATLDPVAPDDLIIYDLALYDSLSFHHDIDQKQFYVVLKRDIDSTQSLYFNYGLKKNVQVLSKEQVHSLQVKTTNRESLLDPFIIHQLDNPNHFINPIIKHLYLLKKLPLTNPIKLEEIIPFIYSSLTVEQKIDKLIEFCEFSNTELMLEPQSDFENWLSCIAERKGVCRHRVGIFTLLLQWLGVPVLFHGNEFHAFVEIPYILDPSNPNETHLIKVDLGGGEINDETPEEERTFKAKKSKRSSVRNSDKKMSEETDPNVPTLKMSEEIESNNTPLKTYSASFQADEVAKEFQSIDELDNNEKSPLILLDPEHSPIKVNAWLLQEYMKKYPDLKPTEHHLYIHSAKDFDRYSEAISIQNGTRVIKDGILKQLVQNGGVLIVNFSDFTDNELAYYKSMFDIQPLPRTLGKFNISPNLKIIGLSSEQLTDSSVSSRLTKWKLSKDITLDNAVPPQTSNDLITIDLAHHYYYLEKLLGTITLNGKFIQIHNNGALTQAIQSKKSICIYNPPENDAAFNELVDRINHEHKFYYNGSITPVDPSVFIYTENKVIAQHFMLIAADHQEIRPDAHWLTANSWFELFEQYIFNNEEQSIQTVPGLLKLSGGINDFNVVGTIAECEWHYLFQYLHDHHLPYSRFKFYLSDQAQVYTLVPNSLGVLSEPNKPTNRIVKQYNMLPIDPFKAVETIHTPVIISNDPDYFALQQSKLLGANVVIIDVNEKTSVNELLVKTTYKPNKITHGFDFHYERQILWLALEENKKVYLKGIISEKLFQQLGTLFDARPHLRFNAQTIYFNGSLSLIIPYAMRQRFNLDTSVCDYPLAYYHQVFPNQSDLLDRIYSMKKWVDTTYTTQSHQIMPINYHSLKLMITALQSHNRHKNNPLKGFINYQFAKSSSEYAVINVMAKVLLTPTGEPSINSRKLNNLKSRLKLDFADLNDYSNHFWHILNCCNGAQISIIFDYDINKIQDFEQLTTAEQQFYSSILMKEIRTQAYQVSNETHTKHTMKHINTLRILAVDDTTPLIVIKGDSGVGKTHAVKAILNKDNEFEVYDSLKDMERWIASSSDKIKILFVDNNLKGLEFIKGIGRHTVIYKRSVHTLTNKHKIIMTCTRPNLGLFSGLGETVLIARPNDDFLLRHIVLPGLKNTPNGTFECAQQFMNAVQHSIQYTHTALDIRTLQSLLARFYVKLNEPIKSHQSQLLYQICCDEFLGLLDTPSKRNQYMQSLSKSLSLAQEEVNQQNLFIYQGLPFPEHNRFIINILEEHLKMRDYAAIDSQFIYRRVVLLEGPSGIGKSLLLETFMKAQGYRSVEPNQIERVPSGERKLYCRITAGNKNAGDLLLKAAKARVIVIIDELNLDDEEQGLAAYLDELCSADYPEFVVYASQNPSLLINEEGNAVEFAGRRQLNASLKDRAQLIKLSSYEKPILIEIANFYGVKQAVDFVDAYIDAHKNSAEINMRTFYLDARKFGLRQQQSGEEDNPPAKRQKLI